MSGFGAKLSRHVLGMKFMRKTKDQVDKNRIEKVHRDHFAPVPSSSGISSDAQAEGINGSADCVSIKTNTSTPAITQEISTPCGKNETSTPSESLIVEELWSYNQCERYVFGRQSFGGFNPVVENNVKKGIWKPFYLDESETIGYDDEEDAGIKQNQSDMDVSDEEMAKTYGSLIGTLAKRFAGKNKKDAMFKKHKKEKEEQNRNKKSKWNKNFDNRGTDDNSGKHKGKPENEHSSARGKFMRKRRGKNKRQRDSTGSTNYRNDDTPHNTGSSQAKRRGNMDYEDHDTPPQKKAKFLKPSDD